jgi:hypothetical protein
VYDRRVWLIEHAARIGNVTDLPGARRLPQDLVRLDEESRTVGVRKREGAAPHILGTAEPRTAALTSITAAETGQVTDAAREGLSGFCRYASHPGQLAWHPPLCRTAQGRRGGLATHCGRRREPDRGLDTSQQGRLVRHRPNHGAYMVGCTLLQVHKHPRRRSRKGHGCEFRELRAQITSLRCRCKISLLGTRPHSSSAQLIPVG